MQIIVIHGGNPFNTYENYVSYLHKKPIYFDKFRTTDWKQTLGQKLGEKYEVILPQMPCKENAKYSEWKIWFERLIPYFEKEVIFIGHSLGGIFLAKWLSENMYPKEIKALFLIAAPYKITGNSQEKCDFIVSDDLSLLNKQVSRVLLYHSKDDPVVEFDQINEYIKRIPSAEQKIFTNMKHFNMLEFPEIIENIKEITK